jgi:hypothetical protein
VAARPASALRRPAGANYQFSLTSQPPSFTAGYFNGSFSALQRYKSAPLGSFSGGVRQHSNWLMPGASFTSHAGHKNSCMGAAAGGGASTWQLPLCAEPAAVALRREICQAAKLQRSCDYQCRSAAGQAAWPAGLRQGAKKDSHHLIA